MDLNELKSTIENAELTQGAYDKAMEIVNVAVESGALTEHARTQLLTVLEEDVARKKNAVEELEKSTASLRAFADSSL